MASKYTKTRKIKRQAKIEKFFVKGGFLYNVYSEENVGKCESEVTEYAVMSYQKYYKPYLEEKDWSIGNAGNELGRRPQMSQYTKGCYLTKKSDLDEKQEYNIDIVADILTSPMTPLKKCFGMKKAISYKDHQDLCKRCHLACIQNKIREIAE